MSHARSTTLAIPFATAVLAVCVAAQEPVRPSSQTPHLDTPPGVLKTAKRTYNIRVVPKEIDEDEVDLPAAVGGDTYVGKDRRAAKLSVGSGDVEDFSDVADLIASLPDENSMANHVPPITRLATSDRVAEERRNVRVTCYLYAASKESDNDFHLILGRDPGASPGRYITMEVSGLPPANFPAFTALRDARKSFKDFFASNLPGTAYSFFDPPIPVTVEGSLFFDITHLRSNPRPGPASLRANMPVIWEVHPVTKITFEP